MQRTYTVYVVDRGGGRRFVPVLCLGEIELLQRARAMLAADPDAIAVEAYFAGAHLFTLEA